MVVFYFISTDFGVTVLILPLEKAYPPPKQLPFRRPYIVVLTGGAHELSHLGLGPSASDSSLRRLIYGIEIFRSSEEPTLVIAGGRGSASAPQVPEAMVLQKIAIALGISAERIVLEMNSRDTWENAENLKPILKEGTRPVVLVTSAFHMPRAVWCFKKAGIEVVPAPTDYRSSPLSLYSLLPSAEALRNSTIALSEYMAIAWYFLIHRLTVHDNSYQPGID